MSKNENIDKLKTIVSLCKRRGFIYPGSDIYGGFANTYSYGPYGAELKKQIKELWWKEFVHKRPDMVGIDGPILLHPKVWEASGHASSFSDALVDCKECKFRFRADHLLEEALGEDVEGLSPQEMSLKISEGDVKCPKCKAQNFTEVRNFNLMFKTELSKTGDHGNVAYLRPETAQAIFTDFKNIIDSTRVKVPFGVAQIGKAFRNEITPGNFIFRVIEFEQMEIEYFIEESEWKEGFEKWLKAMQDWCKLIGLNPEKCHLDEHKPEKLSHYSKRTVDVMYDFPFGRGELYGLAYRTDFDLKQHQEHSKQRMEVIEPTKRYIPHVLEPTFGVDRTILAILCDAYEEEVLPNGESRTVLHLNPSIAPVKVGVFPLMKKGGLAEKAQELFAFLSQDFISEYDASGNIGKRYRRQDELGTPFCVTVDYQTLEDDTVTLRDRDTMGQERVAIADLGALLKEKLI